MIPKALFLFGMFSLTVAAGIWIGIFIFSLIHNSLPMTNAIIAALAPLLFSITSFVGGIAAKITGW